MKLEKTPKEIEKLFDEDSFIYETDDKLYYNPNVDKRVVDDILTFSCQIYSGYYTWQKGDKSPRIFLIGRGKTAGKFKIKIQNFKPYLYENNDEGEYTTYLGRKCEKLIFEMHPSMVARYRDIRRKKGYPLPYESDILFCRRFLIDMYDFFKSKEPITPKIAIVDVETNHPVSDDIIAWSINNMENNIIYESKFDTPDLRELTQHLYDKLMEYDLVTGWNISFDIEMIDKMLGIKTSQEIAVIDLLKISRKMYGREVRGNWSLDNVGTRLCGLGKIHIGAKKIKDLNEKDLMEYNVRDVIIPEIIDNQLGGLEGHMILSWELQSFISEMILTAVVNDIALLRAYHKAGLVLPSRDYSKSKKKDKYNYKAAEPDARIGIYRDIIGMDILHAYPSAVISKNMSPETKDPEGNNVAPNGVRFNDEDSIFITTLKDLMKSRGKVKKKLKSLDKKHKDYRKLKSIDFAIKTEVAALSHGMFGWPNSRVRDYELADAITSVVRDLIDRIKDACDIINKPWCYCHTDGIFLQSKEKDVEYVSNYLNGMIENYFKKDKIVPSLEFDGYYPHGYIHSKARRVLVPKGININDDENWIVKGCNFMRSETPEPLSDIEIKLIKMRMANKSRDEMIIQLKEDIKELINANTSHMGVIKPLSKNIKEYGKMKKSGEIGGIPFWITALKRAKDEYGFSVNIGDKYSVIPIITDETTGVRVIRRKRVFMAYNTEKGLPKNYNIDYTNYLKSNLWGKICDLFIMTPKKLEETIMTDDVKSYLFVEMI